MTKAATRVRGVICCVLYLMAGCVKSPAPGSTAGRAGGATTPASTAPSVCSRLILKAGDFSGILTTPIIRSQPFPGRSKAHV